MTAEFPLAVHALVYLLHKGRVVSSRELAESICTNPARVRKVMAALCRAGLARACRGQSSGYAYPPGGAALPLRRVLEALSETPVEVNWRPGAADRDCRVSTGMAAVMDGVYGTMNEACLRRLEDLTIPDLHQQLFEQHEPKTVNRLTEREGYQP